MSKNDINQAVQILRAGGLVAFPTETVYGLGADACNEEAIKRVFAAKQRPTSHPLIVHLASKKELANWARDIPPQALTLANQYWPGPLTLILKKQPWVSSWVTAGQDTVALRVPHHPIANALLEEFGSGLVAPSANQFTHLSPTTAAAVYDELGEQVDMILDGGACEVGVESTIIDLTTTPPMILRPGMLNVTDIATVLNMEIKSVIKKSESHTRAPGMHFLHYAPSTRTISLADEAILAHVQSLAAKNMTCAVLSYSQVFPIQHQIKLANDPKRYAHDLYQVLRELDNLHVDCIIIEALPVTLEWDALRDRVNKATGQET